jgi:hypothetical protein
MLLRHDEAGAEADRRQEVIAELAHIGRDLAETAKARENPLISDLRST